MSDAICIWTLMTDLTYRRSEMAELEKEEVGCRKPCEGQTEEPGKACEAGNIPCDGMLLLHKYKEDIVNSLECGLMVMDHNGMVIVFNRAAGEITDEDPEEVIFSQAEDHKTLAKLTHLMRSSFNKPTRREEIELETRSGEKRTIGISTYLMRHGGEGVVGVIAVFSDLTHVKAREELRVGSGEIAKEEEMAAGTYFRRHDRLPEDHEVERRLAVLVADADPSTRDFYMEVLERAGCEVLLARDREEIIWKTFHEVVDLLILDLEMPDSNGIEIVQRLLKTDPDLPVVCTGSANAENGYVLVYNNVVSYLPKPVSIIELKRAVAKGLELVARRREVSVGS
jgi:PAS domain S-box-containing protein